MPLVSLGKATQAVGLDIGTRSIRVAEVLLNKQPPVLSKVGLMKIPEGLIIDGEIADVKGVSGVLREMWKKAGFAKRDIVIGVANQKVIVRVIDMPQMTEEELKGAIKFQAADYIPMPIEETIIDFEILKEYEIREDEKMMKVLLVAAQRDMIQSFVDALAGAGLTPASIDVKSFALMRSLIPKLATIPSEDDAKKAMSTACLLNVGAGVSNMVIIDEGMPYFVRILLFGGNDFSKVLADQLKITEDEAESLKMTLSNPTGGRKSADQKAREKKAEEALRPKLGQFVREIRRSIDYCLDQTGCRPPERIILSGRGAQIAGLTGELEKALQVEVEQGMALQNVKVGKINLDEAQIKDVEPSLAVPIGLALKGTEL